MIGAQDLYSVVARLVGGGSEPVVVRRRVEQLAVEFDLSVQEIATVFRVAAGEGFERVTVRTEVIAVPEFPLRAGK